MHIESRPRKVGRLESARIALAGALLPGWVKGAMKNDGRGFTIFRPQALRKGIFDSPQSKHEQLKAFRSIVYAMTHARAKEVANAGKAGKFKVVIEREQDKVETVAVDHPLVVLLRNPNPHFTRWHMWYLTVASLDTLGNSYWWLAKDGLKVPRAIWPLPAERMTIVKGDPSRGEPLIKAYEIDWGHGNTATIPEEDVVHLRYPNPQDLYYYGASLVQRGAAEVDIDWFMTMHQRDFGANDAMPAGLITFPEILDETVRKAFEEEWLEKFKRKPGEIGYLEGGATFQPLLSAKELDYIESTGVNRKRLQTIWGVPDSKLMLEENITARATLETLDYNFLKETIDPLCTMIDEQLTLDLAKKVYDEKLAVIHDNIIPRDVRQEAELDQIHLASGTTHINEIRERDGLEPYPYPAAQEPLVAFGMTPLSQVMGAAQPPPPQDGTQDGTQDEPAKAKNIPEDVRLSRWKNHDVTLARWEKHFAQLMRHYFNGIQKEVQENVGRRGKADLAVSELMFDVDAWLRKLQPIISREALAIIKDSFTRFVKEHSLGDLVFNASDPTVHEGLMRITHKTRTVPKSLYDDLYRTIKAAIDRGEGTTGISKEVSRFFAGQTDYRSMRIARTNANYAVNKGNEVAAVKANVFRGKVWITQRDNLVRDLHLPLDGVEVDMKGKFHLANGDVLDAPGDPAATKGESVINCRCTIMFQTKEEG